ncbi:MAG: PP2C family protein-serine/threonine phosphatase [Bryobacter sp.]|nr:PP2C family protein-serine/threonine phosphatase [Bryobacter sp.]
MTPIPGFRRPLPTNRTPLQFGWWERLFALLLVTFVSSSVMQWSPLITGLSLAGVIITAPVAIWRVGRMLLRSFIWKLRNRLIVAYVFIALVPLVLLGVLVVAGAYVVTGQMAIYLVTSELDRQVATLRAAAESVSRIPPGARQASVENFGNYFEQRLPGFAMRIDEGATLLYPAAADLPRPPSGTRNYAGLFAKDGEFMIGAHWSSPNGEVTAVAPLTSAYLSNLVPGLGPVSLVGAVEETPSKGFRLRSKSASAKAPAEVPIPDPQNLVDIRLNWFSFVPLQDWANTNHQTQAVLRIQTRVFSVLRVIFSNQSDWDQNFRLNPLSVLTTLFIIFELMALIIGVSLTRSITKAIHELSEGTGRVMEGDFAYRIPIKGVDQLAELGHSFNRMSEHLEQLLQVAKENERLNADLEIAREVQRQLYPKGVPDSPYLQLTAHYQPARMVSGDYFDFYRLTPSRLCFTAGDVAGKGISAALLMATVQASFRSQIQSAPPELGTAKLVTELNKQLYANTAPEKFSTFFFGIFDEDTRLLHYTNAGHLPPILIRQGEAQLLAVDGMVVGAFPFAQYQESSIALQPDDLLVLYTDGISEPQNEFGEMFGEDRLIDLLRRHCRQPESKIIESILHAVQEWTGTPELQDDMTILLVRHK